MDTLNSKRKYILQLLKGAFFAVSISLVGILLFALLIKFTSISDKWIMPINQIIKIVSIFFGVLLSFERGGNQGFLKGLIIGIVYTIFAYLVFSILAGKFSFSLNSFTDMLFGGLIGGISGILAVNIKK